MSSFESSPVKVRDDALFPELAASLRQYAHGSHFGTVTSPYDGVQYPDLLLNVPKWIEVAIRVAISEMMGVSFNAVDIGTQFFRLTTENTPVAPHGAHNDAIHGKYSAFYYINDCPNYLQNAAGTSLLTHKVSGLSHQPQSVEQWDVWNRDTNDYDAWHVDELVEWKPNRLAIYPADRMHRAEPPGGWGIDASNGRLVLITFFSC